LLKSAHTNARFGLRDSSPLDSVRSEKVPSPLLWSKESGSRPVLVQPGASGDVDVEETVVVIVRLRDVETARNSNQPRLSGPILESTSALVDKKAELAALAPGRKENVEEAVVVEIVQNRAAGVLVDHDPELSGALLEAWKRLLGLENFRGDHEIRVAVLRVLAQPHAHDGEQPAESRRVRMTLQVFQNHLLRHLEPISLSMQATVLDREKATVAIVPRQTVIQLADP
jgi:hypothetical protein